jgi:pyridoxamine 5'-phosphate oxidase
MNDWHTTADSTLDQVWTLLARGTKDRRAATRHMTLATVGKDGPEQRTLVLRGVDRAHGTIDLHTDLRTPKVSQISNEPRVALHCWDARAHLQIRAKGTATVLTGTDVDHLWDRVPDPSRRAYGATPPPGTPLPDNTHPVGQDQAAFAVLRITLTSLDTLHLGRDQHRRFSFASPDWTGIAIAP